MTARRGRATAVSSTAPPHLNFFVRLTIMAFTQQNPALKGRRGGSSVEVPPRLGVGQFSDPYALAIGSSSRGQVNIHARPGIADANAHRRDQHQSANHEHATDN